MTASAESTRELQRQRLQAEINRYIGRGFRVLNQTDTTAQLVRPKKFSLLWFIIWLILGLGVGALIYAGWYMAKRDEQVYLTVDADGKVQATNG
jgi:hypothetical protein